MNELLQKAQPLVAAYISMLRELRAELEALYGPLFWDEVDAAPLDDGSVRVGEIAGAGVQPAEIDLPVLRETVNRVLERHRFAPRPDFGGSRSGHVECRSVDRAGVRFVLLVKSEAQAWIDIPPDRLG